MKTLYLIRHAKSDWNNGLKDFDRPLSGRGISDASRIGKHLLNEGVVPNLILSSSANRAISTARLIAAEMVYAVEKIEENKNLYHASPKEMAREIWKVSNEVETLFVFGHNPGISELIGYLTEDWAELKTCCVAKISLEVDDWKALVRGTGTLKEIISPKEI